MGGLAATHGAEQVEHLLALFEALRGMAEEGDDSLERVLHAVELGEGRVDADGAIEENPSEPGVPRRVDELWLADGAQHSFCWPGVAAGIVAAGLKIVPEAHFGFATLVAEGRVNGENISSLKHQRTPGRED